MTEHCERCGSNHCSGQGNGKARGISIERKQLLGCACPQMVESGTHDELLSQDGFYAKLWRRQDLHKDSEPSENDGETPEAEQDTTVEVESKAH